jgi:predicted transcriptional regulator of viral defense system
MCRTVYYRDMNYSADHLERSLGRKQAALLLTLAERFGVAFTVPQARTQMGLDAPQLARELHGLASKGWLVSLGRDAYMIAPLEAGPDSTSYAVNRYLAAATIAGDRPYYLSYRTAMEIHGMTMHPWRTVYVSTSARLRTRSIQSFEVRPVTISQERLWGWENIEVLPDHRVHVSTPARTIVDCLDRPEYAGGIGDVAVALSLAGTELGPGAVVDAAIRLGKVSVIKRLGVLLELTGNSPDDALKRLAERVTNAPHVLDPQQPRSGSLHPRWKVWMNVSDDSLRQWLTS